MRCDVAAASSTLIAVLKIGQLAVAVLCFAAITADMYLGFGLAPEVVALLAGIAGALGVARPTELATTVVKALPPRSTDDTTPTP